MRATNRSNNIWKITQCRECFSAGSGLFCACWKFYKFVSQFKQGFSDILNCLNRRTLTNTETGADISVRESMCQTINSDSENLFGRNPVTQCGVLSRELCTKQIEKRIKSTPFHSKLSFEELVRDFLICQVRFKPQFGRWSRQSTATILIMSSGSSSLLAFSLHRLTTKF